MFLEYQKMIKKKKTKKDTSQPLKKISMWLNIQFEIRHNCKFQDFVEYFNNSDNFELIGQILAIFRMGKIPENENNNRIEILQC